MKIYILILTVLLTTLVTAQSSSNNIKYYDNGNIKEQGLLTNNQKNGVWITYSIDGGIIEKGNYIDDKKSGIWEEKINEFSIFNLGCCWQGEYHKGKRIGKWYNKDRKAYARYRNGKLNKLIIN